MNIRAYNAFSQFCPFCIQNDDLRRHQPKMYFISTSKCAFVQVPLLKLFLKLIGITKRRKEMDHPPPNRIIFSRPHRSFSRRGLVLLEIYQDWKVDRRHEGIILETVVIPSVRSAHNIVLLPLLQHVKFVTIRPASLLVDVHDLKFPFMVVKNAPDASGPVS